MNHWLKLPVYIGQTFLLLSFVFFGGISLVIMVIAFIGWDVEILKRVTNLWSDGLLWRTVMFLSALGGILFWNADRPGV